MAAVGTRAWNVRQTAAQDARVDLEMMLDAIARECGTDAALAVAARLRRVAQEGRMIGRPFSGQGCYCAVGHLGCALGWTEQQAVEPGRKAADKPRLAALVAGLSGWIGRQETQDGSAGHVTRHDGQERPPTGAGPADDGATPPWLWPLLPLPS